MAPACVDSITLRRFLSRLREDCPIKGLRVRVVRKPAVYVHQNRPLACCNIKGRVATIWLTASLTYEETIDALIHEWAHLLSRDFSHGKAWGVAYATVYRAFHECA